MVQVEEDIATFYCQHPTARSIGWVLDDVPFLQYSPPNVTHITQPSADGQLSIHILTMVAHREIKIQCLASVEATIEIAEPAAFLTVQGD